MKASNLRYAGCGISPTDVAPVRETVRGTDIYAMSVSRNPANALRNLLRQCDAGGADFERSVLGKILGSLVLPLLVFSVGKTEWISKANYIRLARSMRCTLKSLERFHPSGGPSQVQKYAKYWLDKFMAKAVKDTCPFPTDEVFEAVPLFSGYLWRLVKRRLVHADRSFFYSLQKGAKQAWPRLPNSDLVSAFEKHRKLVCRESSASSPHVLKSVREVSNQLFSGLKGHEFTKFQPTGSSCLQRRRKEGGTFGLVAPFLEPVCAGVGRIPATVHSFERHREFQLAEAVRRVSYKSPEDLGRVEVMAVAEPAKFRILTKMDGDLANALQPLQGALLSRWKNSGYSTMRDEDLTPRVQHLVDKHREIHSGFSLYVSGDYSAATDTLRSDLSVAALYGARNSCWYPLGEVSLVPGPIRYPPVRLTESRDSEVLAEGVTTMRTEGQLMGHLLSFPLLCAINLSTYWLALRRWVERGNCVLERRRRRILFPHLKELVIVNGDDIMFLCDHELYELWVKSVAEHSFSLSPGKNYVSYDFVQMNSQIFSVSADGRVDRHGYLSQKTVYGNDIKSGASLAGPIEVVRDLDRMIDQDPRFASVVPMSLARFSDWTYGYLRTPNWYLPVRLGGYGLRLRGPRPSLTRQQRHVAASLVSSRKRLYRVRDGRVSHRRTPFWTDTPHEVVGPYVPLPGEELYRASSLSACDLRVKSWTNTSGREFTIDRARFRKDWRLAPMREEHCWDYLSYQEFVSYPVEGPPPNQFGRYVLSRV